MDYNRSELARKTNLSRQAITNILNGKQKNPKIQTLEKISNAIGCSIGELNEEIKNNNEKNKEAK